VSLYRKKTEIPLNFPRKYKNTPTGTFSSRAPTVGGVKFFGEILGHKLQLLVDLCERISMVVVVLTIDDLYIIKPKNTMEVLG